MVVGQEGVVGVVVGVGVVIKDVARSATLLTTSSAESVSPAVILGAGLTVVPVESDTGAVVVRFVAKVATCLATSSAKVFRPAVMLAAGWAVVLMATSSKILDG